MSTAQATVFSIPELLEHTLTHLPMRDLLVTVPLVSKMWHAMTLTPTLQRLLFFQPDTSSDDDSVRVENPLLVKFFPPFFVPPARDRWSRPNYKAIEMMPWSKAPDAFKRPEASWRRMLVTQSPVQRLVVSLRCHAQTGDFVRRAVLDDPCLRMGVLYDLVLPFCNHTASSFSIRWHGDTNGEDGRDEITLALFYIQQCSATSREYVDKRFHSDAAETVRVEFGESVQVPYAWD